MIWLYEEYRWEKNIYPSLSGLLNYLLHFVIIFMMMTTICNVENGLSNSLLRHVISLFYTHKLPFYTGKLVKILRGETKLLKTQHCVGNQTRRFVWFT